jgi:hypothetical protein
MYAILNNGSLVYGPTAYDSVSFAQQLTSLGISASLPLQPSTSAVTLDTVSIVPVTENKPSYDPTTQQLQAGQPVVNGNTVTINYTAVNLPAPTSAPARTALQIYEAAVALGLSVTSANTPSLNDTYAISPVAVANISAVEASIAAGKGLPGGGSTFIYFGASGPHNFNVTDFQNLAVAIRDYVYLLSVALLTAESGGTPTWPTATAQIP